MRRKHILRERTEKCKNFDPETNKKNNIFLIIDITLNLTSHFLLLTLSIVILASKFMNLDILKDVKM